MFRYWQRDEVQALVIKVMCGAKIERVIGACYPGAVGQSRLFFYTAQVRVLLTPNAVTAIEAVNVAEVLFGKKLRGSLTTIAMVTTYNKRNIEIGILNKLK